MFTMDNADEFGKLVGIQIFEVVVLVDVCLEVIKEWLALTDDELPVTLTNADDLRRPVAHLPIEEVVILLFPVLSKQS